MVSQKTATFAVMHMSVAFSVVYAMTGSLALGGAVAMIEPAVNTVAYFFHEKVWERLGIGSARDRESFPSNRPHTLGIDSPPALDPVARCLQCQWRARHVGESTGD